MSKLTVGSVLYGYCGGFFGRDSYTNKRVEAVGADWIVVRENGVPDFYAGDLSELEQYLEEENEGNM